jgi:hypothetical protein
MTHIAKHPGRTANCPVDSSRVICAKSIGERLRDVSPEENSPAMPSPTAYSVAALGVMSTLVSFTHTVGSFDIAVDLKYAMSMQRAYHALEPTL